MNVTREGSLHLFRIAGINVFVHWSWFLAAVYFMQARRPLYDSPAYAVLDYLILFVIIMMHEFGHALSCRQVGGFAHDIILSPLGGVAYVDPPHRPGAYLWCIAAGPLVNAALVPILWGLQAFLLRSNFGLSEDTYTLIHMVYVTNWVLLIFNLLPVYPMDGGRILQALLWFRLGYRRALLTATTIGFVGCGLLGVYAISIESTWLGVLTVFFFINCRNAWMQARSASF
jgi:Zn-dependent protease